MKITAYEVRPDEKDYLLAAAQQEQIEITLVQGPMTQDNIDRAEGADGITILGHTRWYVSQRRGYAALQSPQSMRRPSLYLQES